MKRNGKEKNNRKWIKNQREIAKFKANDIIYPMSFQSVKNKKKT